MNTAYLLAELPDILASMQAEIESLRQRSDVLALIEEPAP